MHASVGITEYLGEALPEHEYFKSATIKHRYSDFVVREVSAQGVLVRLTDLASRKDERAEKDSPKEETDKDGEAVQRDDRSAEEDMWSRLGTLLATVYSDADVAAEAMTAIQALVTRQGGEPAVLPAIDDKHHRTVVHDFFKTAATTTASLARIDTETAPGGHIWLRCGSASRKRRRAQRDPPLHVLFHMYKENRDTMEAIQRIAHLMHIPVAHFSYAGTKDRRGITVQQVCLRWNGSEAGAARRLASLNRALARLHMAVGNVRRVEQPLGLGDLAGNHFDLLLRGLPADPVVGPALVQTALRLAGHGFINYFGMQRFGHSQAAPTWAVGAQLLLQNWPAAVDLILCPRPGPAQPDDSDGIVEIRRRWVDDRAGLLRDRAALCDIKARHIAERAILRHLSDPVHAPQDCLGALEALPHELRLLYLHSLQSLIWNAMASKRLSGGPASRAVLVGDLVLSPRDDVFAPAAAAPAPVVVESAAQTSEYALTDVVLPLPGHAIAQYPAGMSVTRADYDAYIRTLADGLSLSLFETSKGRSGKLYHLSGVYRHLVVKPVHMTAELVVYADINQKILRNDLDDLLEPVAVQTEPSPSSELSCKGLRVTFALPASSYATMALRECLRSETSASCQSQNVLK